eukprot:1382082-Amorphochlora_amoeboformis.AAC.3
MKYLIGRRLVPRADGRRVSGSSDNMTEIRRHNGPALMTLIAIFIVIKTNVSTDPFILTSRIGEPGVVEICTIPS